MMDIDTFWDIIEQSGTGKQDCSAQADKLVEILSTYPPQEVADFDRLFLELRHKAYRWDLWGIAYIINFGCSDDGFEYFRCWLIGRGRAFYEQALADAESVADQVDPENADVECEDLMYAAHRAYEALTGKELPQVPMEHPESPSGTEWNEEDDLPKMFPRACARFGF
jgi:hypothetical protein